MNNKEKLVTNIRKEDMELFKALCKKDNYSVSEVMRKFVAEVLDSFLISSKGESPSNPVKKFMKGEVWQTTRHLL